MVRKELKNKGLWINVHVKNMASSRTLQDEDFCIAFLINTDKQKHTHTHTHTQTRLQYLRQLFPYGTHIQRTMGNYALFYTFSALLCYSRVQQKILHVRDHAQWFGPHLPWETQLSKQALSIIVHKTWQIVLDRQSCPSFRSVTFQNLQPKPFPTNKHSFLKYRNAHLCE